MLERLRNGSWSIHAQYLLYSSALLIPALVFSGLMILRSAALERAAMEGDIADVVHSVATAIDRELAGTVTTLEALASSPALTAGDFKAFYNQAAAVQAGSGTRFYLTNRSGRQILDTRVAWGDDVPQASGANIGEIFEDGKTQVSNLYRGADGEATFSISVPVKRGSRRIYVLSASISPSRIADILDRASLDPGWLATVTDSAGVVVATSKDFAEHVGKPLPTSHWGDTQSGSGLWSGFDSDGQAVLRASAIARQSGWIVSTSVPEVIANRPIIHSWALVATLALSFALLSALLAYLFARRISDPFRALVERASQLGSGQPVALVPSSIAEVRAVSEALVNASETRRSMECSLRESEDRLRLALASADTGTWDWDLTSGALTWDARMRELWGLGPDDPVSFEVFRAALNPLDLEATLAAIERAQDATSPVEYDVEHRVRAKAGGVERWVAATGRAHFADGIAVRMTGTARDITERKRWEDHIQLLMREVTHRSKNLLAVIQAMARQTRRASRDVEDFEARFSERLQALAASHDLLVQRNWQGVSIAELVRSQLGHYLDQQAGQINIDGQGLVVTPEAAQNIGLAVHELSTNAAKYGALSVPEGRVEVRWDCTGNGASSDRRLRMSWTEKGGPQVVLPSHRGFGQLVTEQIAARALQGEATLSFDRAGVHWTLDVPARNILVK